MKIGLAAASLGIVGLFAAYRTYRGPAPVARSPKSRQLLIAGADAGYVDSTACAACHRQIWDTYRQTGMGRSFARAGPKVMGGEFNSNSTFYHSASDRYYTMLSRDGKYYLRRHQKGFDGKEENVVEKEIHYVTGSGNHARTYLHRTPEGRLVELPVTWYSENGGHWAMSPGFDNARHSDFRREIMYECVFCHTGYPELEPAADTSGHAPLFPGRIPEGIDCQRCHGPGRRHIEAAASGKFESIRAAIVNPKRLSPERQLEICMQCHLETTSSRLPHTILRFDRGAFSYRPGTPLSDFVIHFDHEPGAGRDDKFEIAHQAYRLRKSACFQKSNGRLTCTTCHDPHVPARSETARERYTNACRGCHTPQLERLVAAARHTAATNCIDCHMPKRRTDDVVNVVMTDHLIQRRKPPRDLLAPLQERTENEAIGYKGPVVPYYPPQLSSTSEGELYLAVAQVKQFNNLKEGIPKLAALLRESPNADGEFYFELGESYGQTGQNSDAIRCYQQAIQRKPGFRPAWLGLGRSLSKSGQFPQAVEALEKAASAGPENATILNDLALAYLAAGRRDDAVRVLQRAVTVDPDHAESQNNLGNALRELGDLAGAERAYREAVRAQPDFVAPQQQLANLLATRGNFAEADHHYRQIILQDPKSASLRQEYGAALASVEKYDQALDQFEAATRLDPALASAHLGLADMLALRGRMAQAIDHYRRALALEPDLGAGHLGLASALEAKGVRSEAILHLEKAAQSSDAAIVQAAREALQSLRGVR